MDMVTILVAVAIAVILIALLLHWMGVIDVSHIFSGVRATRQNEIPI